MKRVVSLLAIIAVLSSCIILLSSCGPRDGDNLRDIENLLMDDPEMSDLFSSISVVIYNKKTFTISASFNNVSSEAIGGMTQEEACNICKNVYDKVHAVLLEEGWSIRWIDGHFYPSDQYALYKNDVEYYSLHFGLAAENKTYVSVYYDKEIWSEEVTWGGWEE